MTWEAILSLAKQYLALGLILVLARGLPRLSDILSFTEKL